MPADTSNVRAKRGFAVMSADRRREVAAKGGAAVPPEKRSFSKDRALAASAGKAGGSHKPSDT